jgi:ribonuclease HII
MLTPRRVKHISIDGAKSPTGEVKRLGALRKLEVSLGKKGFKYIAGVDEAGRGPLAGPLVASAVVLKPGVLITGVDDSKKLTSSKREKLYPVIIEHSIAVSTSIIDVNVVDVLNVRGAANEAMRRAVLGLDGAADYVLFDGLKFPGVDLPHEFIIGGDGKCHCIAAASIIAKVTRDRIMAILDRDYPEYGFSRNKGYPTRSHRQALLRCGPTPVHRMSYPSVQMLIGESDRLQQPDR